MPCKLFLYLFHFIWQDFIFFFQLSLCMLSQFLILNTFVTSQKKKLHFEQNYKTLTINHRLLYSAVLALLFLWTWILFTKIPLPQFQLQLAAFQKYRLNIKLPMHEFQMHCVFLNITPTCSPAVLQYTLSQIQKDELIHRWANVARKTNRVRRTRNIHKWKYFFSQLTTVLRQTGPFWWKLI